METQIKNLICWLVLMPMVGCSLLPGSQNGPEEATQPAEIDPNAAAKSDDFESLSIEHKQARIWARLDEIEREQIRQKSRIRLLEKGLLLGVVPDELRNPDDVEHERRIKAKAQEAATSKSESPKQNPPSPPPVPVAQTIEKSTDRAQYDRDLAEAQDQFREGKYGRALVSFEQIGAKYSDEINGGIHKYWIGLCWFNLKDFEAAQKSLSDLVAKNPSSPWIPRAKLYLARIQIRNGLKEQGLQSLRKIIQDHANEDAAEMARADIEGLKKEL